MFADPALWWCCLRNEERAALTLLLPFAADDGIGIAGAAFTVILTTSGIPAGSVYDVFFRDDYQFLFVPIEIDGVSVDWVFFNTVFWLILQIFAGTSEFSCPMKIRPCNFSSIY